MNALLRRWLLAVCDEKKRAAWLRRVLAAASPPVIGMYHATTCGPANATKTASRSDLGALESRSSSRPAPRSQEHASFVTAASSAGEAAIAARVGCGCARVRAIAHLRKSSWGGRTRRSDGAEHMRALLYRSIKSEGRLRSQSSRSLGVFQWNDIGRRRNRVCVYLELFDSSSY